MLFKYFNIKHIGIKSCVQASVTCFLGDIMASLFV